MEWRLSLSLSLALKLTQSIVSHSVGRVLTRKLWEDPHPCNPLGTWELSGQCVCVIHPRLLITAAHVCWGRKGQLDLRVLYSPAHGPTLSFKATPLRYSGRMDVAFLLLDVLPADSPFTPADVANPSDHSNLFEDGEKVNCCMYPIWWDLMILQDVPETTSGPGDHVIVTAATLPHLLVSHHGTISADQAMVLPPDQRGIARQFRRLVCHYSSPLAALVAVSSPHSCLLLVHRCYSAYTTRLCLHSAIRRFTSSGSMTVSSHRVERRKRTRHRSSLHLHWPSGRKCRRSPRWPSVW